MFEILLFIIIIVAVTQKNKKKQNASRQRDPYQSPSVPVPPAPKKTLLSQTAVKQKVNQQIFGTSNPKDKVTLYNRLILTDRYRDMEKMAHELGVSKFKVLRDIQDLQKEGHYKNVTIDERNYKLIYADDAKKERVVSQPQTKSEPERTFIEPTKPYRPSRNAAERYEQWFPIPEGKEVCRCGYCGADNLISKRGSRSQYTCYFCREEL